MKHDGGERVPRGLMRWLLSVALLVALGLMMARRSRPVDPTVVEWAGTAMGTTYTIKVRAPVAPDVVALRALGERELSDVNRRMSTYDPESELSHFNRYSGVEPYVFSPATMTVLVAARAISARSGGAFDPTVAPLVDAWGFGPAGPSTVPTDRELAMLLDKVGFDQLEIDSAAGTVRKRRGDVTLDLSAIAKGYGVDRVAGALEAEGIVNYLVEVGGEVRGRGARSDSAPWRVGIETPASGSRTVFEAVPLVDMAVATSGDYRNFFERDGATWSHLVDPHSGRAVPYVGRSISVFHPEAMVADAWATALAVLDLETGLRLAEREGIAVVMVVAVEAGYRSHTTPAFDAYRTRAEAARAGANP